MHRLLALSMIGLTGLLAGACSNMTSSPTGPASSTSSASADVATQVNATLSFCTDEINRYRASVGEQPLARSASLEAFAADAAQKDAAVRIAHEHFRETNGGGISHAETEILWWKDQDIRDVVQRGLAQMWNVGPGGEHYEIIVGPYTQVGCGIEVNGNEVTVAQDFR